MATFIDLLASEYLTKHYSMEHGLNDPLHGGFSIMRDLQEDLLYEQKHNKSASLDQVENSFNVFSLYETADLYTEILECDGEVIATSSDIICERNNIVEFATKLYTEVFYSATLTYHINIASILSDLGVPRSDWGYITVTLSSNPEAFKNYITSYGIEGLFDKWLPAKKTDLGYSLDWELLSVSYRPDYWMDVVISITERHLDQEIKINAG